MNAQLTVKEKRYLEEFLKSISETKLSPMFSYLYSSVISFLGLILLTAAVIITFTLVPKLCFGIQMVKKLCFEKPEGQSCVIGIK